MLVVTLVLSGGVAGLERSSSLDQFKSDGPEAQQLKYAEANFGDEDDTTTTQILVRDENVLSKESLIATLELQREFREDETVSRTLVEDDPFADLSTIVATTAIREERSTDARTQGADPSAADPTIDEQIEQLESMDQSEIDAVLETILDGEGQGEALVFLPTDYEPGSTQADARLLFVTQQADGQQVIEGESSEEIVESQLAMDAMVEERFVDGFAFGEGIITDEIDRSLVDSLSLVLPLALLFVCLVLAAAYRDLLDILLGLAGIVIVLLWTLGFMGWVGIPFTQIMVAVPALLVGLSIDYAIHVFMRHRERRGDEGTDSSGAAMRIVLGGLGVALLWVTTTAVFGFLSNLVSPVAPIREFGLVSAFGIAAALLVFGVLVPAAKVELDTLLEARGIDRRNRAFGTGGAFAGVLSLGERAAHRVPWAVVFAVLLVTAAGAAGATQVDTTFEREDFIADDPPAWMASLPGPLAPGEYSAKEDLAALNQHARQDTRTQVVITGDVADDRTLERIADAHDVAEGRDAVLVRPNGDAGVRSPLSVMRAVAAEDESFNEAFVAADTDGDGVPDEDVEAVYDALYEADAERAGEVIHRTDGEYEGVRMLVTMQGDAASEAMADDTRAVAAPLDGAGLEATATGQPVVFSVIEDELFETVIQSLSVTLGAVAVLLTLVYRRTVGSATLGIVTLAPIVCSVAWILGTMALLGVPFNAITGTITSLTVGLGVAYNIHMTERYLLERRHDNDAGEALRRSVRGTGGALLGSAATTVGGFGVLVFAILPPLQQFGLITGLTIVYAFAGSVFVLPSLLVLWERHVGPLVEFSVGRPAETTVTDGGRE